MFWAYHAEIVTVFAQQRPLYGQIIQGLCVLQVNMTLRVVFATWALFFSMSHYRKEKKITRHFEAVSTYLLAAAAAATIAIPCAWHSD